MLLKLLACNVFMREACHCIATSPHVIDVEFLELGEHIHSASLRERLQTRIEAAESAAKRYDAILLLYGLCGNSAVGLVARRLPLVIPRAHDCCTILLGSRERFKELFADNPSMPFSSTGYLERGDYYLRVSEGDGSSQLQYGDAFAAYVEQYGEEDAKFIWDSLHPPHLEEATHKALFVDLPETAHLGHAERFRAKVEADGKEFVRVEGNMRLIRHLLDGEWDPAEFLIVPPGSKTVGIYDWSEVVRAGPAT